MFEQLYPYLPFIIGAGVLVFALVLMVLVKVRSHSNKRLDAFRQQTRALEKELAKTNKQLLEVRSVMVGLGQKVSEQQDVIGHLNDRVTELEHVDSDGRLYSRASKMVQLGAGINELIEECELPKAEAELMMSLQSKIAGKEKVPSLHSHPERQSSVSKSQPLKGKRRPMR
ncbi:DUF2802 domain-containing protein [Vibrio sp. SCSIO 43136]|uniref:DUF2802 domain-containing protein n=1 Tax=Vibrio sp. SCSIO 43136 TaxID=2819101 RepID=UPI00256F6220|nr:DUF2802 domain-containing protein [Vibrio sp. SCSIO 43136]